MTKRNLNEWAAISEIVGTLAVVISLLFVAFSLRQNTRLMQAANDNFIYQTQDAILSTLVEDPSLVSIYIKHRNNEELTDIELERIFDQELRDLFMWEVAYARQLEGLYSPNQWEALNKAYSAQFTTGFPDEWSAEARVWFGDDFAAHVDAIYAKARQ